MGRRQKKEIFYRRYSRRLYFGYSTVITCHPTIQNKLIGMTIQPQTINNEIIKELNQLSRSGEFVNDFIAQKLYAKAKKTMQQDAALAYSLLGMIAQLHGKVEAMRDYHSNAIQLDRCRGRLWADYAASLQHSGYFTEALDKAAKACELLPGNLFNIEFVINIAVAACQFDTALEYLGKWQKLKPGEVHPRANPVLYVTQHPDFNEGVSRDFGRMMDKIGDIFRQRHLPIPFFQISMLTLPDGETDVMYRIPVFRPVEEVAEMNFQIVEELVGEVENMHENILLFNLTAEG